MALFFDIAPFVGLLLSIALLPLWFPRFWGRAYGLVSLFWSLGAFIPECLRCSGGWLASWMATALEISVPLLTDFVPFILLISALYVVTGGITVHVGLRGGPLANTAFLGMLSVLSGFVGTTGAAMLGIRPLIEMNRARHARSHTIIFFIFLVCNVGGCLSTIGDPPLFLGFLKGIPFLWPTIQLLPAFLIVGGALLGLYLMVDTFLWRREGRPLAPLPSKWLVVRGKAQFALMGGILLTLVGTGSYKLGMIHWGPIVFSASNALRNGLLLMFIGLSLWLKPLGARARERWHLHPLKEIAVLFAGIFVTAEPVLHLLGRGGEGPLGPLMVHLLGESPHPLSYFWLTGILSSFLDNAPTYLIFFTMAGGSPQAFLGALQPILVAISLGAVFMGAFTYIGNAPNLLVKTVVEEEYHLPMPSFSGYIIWSSICLLPILLGWAWWCWG